MVGKRTPARTLTLCCEDSAFRDWVKVGVVPLPAVGVWVVVVVAVTGIVDDRRLRKVESPGRRLKS